MASSTPWEVALGLLPRYLALRRREARRKRAGLAVTALSPAEARECEYALQASPQAGRCGEELGLRTQLLEAAQQLSSALCEELRSAESDAAHWTAAVERSERRNARTRRTESLERLAEARRGQAAAFSALHALHASVQPLSPAGLTPAAVASTLSDAAASLLRSLPGHADDASSPAEESRPELSHALVSSALAACAPRSPDWEEANGYPLGLVPPRARRPSAFRRSAPRLAISALLGAVAFHWLYQRAVGGDLQRWAQGGWAALGAAAREHVVEPLRAVAGELFDTFRSSSRTAGLLSAEALEASRASVERQLAAFAEAHPAANLQGEGTEASLDALNRYHEKVMPRPLVGLLRGDLAWALLLDVQKMKLDGEAAMRSLDNVLHANELTLALVAALPSLALVGLGARAAGAAVTAFRRRRGGAASLQPGRAHRALQRRFGDVERVLMAMAQGLTAGEEEEGKLLFALDCCLAAAAALLAPAVARRSGAAAAVAAAALGGEEKVEEELERLQRELSALARLDRSPQMRLQQAQRVKGAHASLQYAPLR